MPPVNRLRPGLIGAVAVIALLLVGVIMGQVAAARVGVIQCTRASLAAAVALWPAAVRLTTSIAACCCCSFWVLLGQGEEHWVVFVDGAVGGKGGVGVTAAAAAATAGQRGCLHQYNVDKGNVVLKLASCSKATDRPIKTIGPRFKPYSALLFGHQQLSW